MENKMINSTITSTKTVNNGENVVFDVDRVRTASCGNGCCGWLSHEPTSGIFTLTKKGVYEVSYNADITSVSTQPVFLELENNGEPIVGSRSTYTVATASAVGNVSSSVFVEVKPGASANITLGNNSGFTEAVSVANITIKKVI